MDITPNTRILDLTVDELMTNIKSATPKPVITPPPSKQYDYGIAGIARTFNCSDSTAKRIKASGKFKDAIKQTGRMIIVDVGMARRIANVDK